MPSALENPEIIEKYLADEIAAGRMGEGLTVEEAHVFFGGHFRTAPMGVVFDQAKPRVIHNLSACDPEGSSTNSWLDAKDWPTKWYTATMFEDAVSTEFSSVICIAVIALGSLDTACGSCALT